MSINFLKLSTFTLMQFFTVEIALAESINTQAEVNLANANAGSAVNIFSADGIMINPASANGSKLTLAGQHNISNRHSNENWSSTNNQLANFAGTWQSESLPELNLGIAYYDSNNFHTLLQTNLSSQQLKFKNNNLVANLAWQLNKKLKIGTAIGVSQAEYGQLNLKNSLIIDNFSTNDQANIWRVGLVYLLSQRMRVGLAYSHQQKYNFDSLNINQNSTLLIPANLTWSVAQKLTDNWETLGSVSVNFKSIKSFSEIKNGARSPDGTWLTKNSLKVSWGANYTINSNWQGNFGLSYQKYQNAAESVHLNDYNRYSLALGGKWNVLLPTTSLDLAYRYQFSPKYSVYNSQINNELINFNQIRQQQIKLQLNHDF